MAFAGIASATVLTSPAGTTYTSTIKAESEGTTSLHNTSLGITVSCTESKVEGNVESHGASSTAGGTITSLTFGGCGTNDVTVLPVSEPKGKTGSLEIHTTVNAKGETEGVTGNGTLTSTGTEITINSTSIGVSCTYKTSATDIGTVTGGTPATLNINSAVIPRTGDSIFCGSSGKWTGSYKVTSPATLLVD